MKKVFTYKAYFKNNSPIEFKMVAQHQIVADTIIEDMCIKSGCVNMEKGISLINIEDYIEKAGEEN